MNVLIVHCGKGIYGGAELVITELANYLYKNGHEVVIAGKNLPADFYDSLRSDISCYKPDTYWSLRNTVQKLIGWADAINAHNFPATLTTFPYRMKTRAVVWMCNEPAEMFTNWWRKPIEALNRWWVRASRMEVVVADRFNADRFERIYKVRPTIIPYGVNYKFWSSGRLRRSSGFVVLQVGHPELFNKGKEIFQEVCRDIPNAELVQLMGESHKKVRDWYNVANVLLHPIGEQGGWLVPFEAICADLPVIVSEEFTGADIIKRNQLGYVTNNYAYAIKKLSEIHKESDVITPHAKKWVKENLSWEIFGEEMVNAYKANLGK